MAPTGTTTATRAAYRGSAGPGSLGSTLWVGLAEQSRRFRHLRRRVQTGRDPEDLHQLRVTVRRLRAALDLGREALDLTETVTNRALARLGKALGRLRDVEVVLGTLAELVPFAKGEQALALDRIQSRLRGRQRALRREIRRALSHPDVDRMADGLRRWVRQPRFFPFAFRRLSAASPGLLRPAESRVRSHEGWAMMPSVGGRFTPEQHAVLHDLRKRAKDVRYRLEIVSRPRPERAARRLTALRDLQDRLGELHDTATLDAVIAAAAKDLGNEDVDWLRRHAAGRAEAAARRWLELREAGYSGTVTTAEGAA